MSHPNDVRALASLWLPREQTGHPQGVSLHFMSGYWDADMWAGIRQMSILFPLFPFIAGGITCQTTTI